jgi:SAM-dependent methyltransferase
MNIDTSTVLRSVFPFSILDTNPIAYKVFLSYLQSIPDEVNALFEDCINKLIDRNIPKIKWLDVGAGLGDPTFIVLNMLQEKGIEVEYYYLDPSSRASMIFYEESKLRSCSSIVKDIIIEKWEDYQSEERYDLITFTHSAYYIDKWFDESQNSLVKAVNLLSPNGLLHFSHLDEEADYIKLICDIRFKGKIKNSPPITSQDIISLCSRSGLPKPLVKKINKYLPVDFIRRNSYYEYKNIVEFLTDKPFTEESSALVRKMPNEMSFPISTISISPYFLNNT